MTEPPFLSPEHRRMLEVGSKIHRSVIEMRGYASVYTTDHLVQTINTAGKGASVVSKQPGEHYAADNPDDVTLHLHYKDRGADAAIRKGRIPQYQLRFPLLLIPVWWNDRVVGHRLRPDKPRTDAKGKIHKYEQPEGLPIHLDAHSLLWKEITDPSMPLFITEGEKKADALTSVRVPTISLLGVWGWLHKLKIDVEGEEATVRDSQPLDEWADVPLHQRQVMIAFDNDAHSNAGVRLARVHHTLMLRERGASVEWLELPRGNAKLGIDDLLASGLPLELLAERLRHQPSAVDLVRGDRKMNEMRLDALRRQALREEEAAHLLVGLSWTTPRQRADKPPMDWRVLDLMPKVGVGVIFGPTYVGKSLLAIDLALSITNCLESWMGFPLVCDDVDNERRLHAGIILMEGAAGFPGRERSWLQAHPKLTNRGLLTFEYQWVDLASETYVDALVESVRGATLDDGEAFAPSLLVVDTQGLASDVDENDRTQVRRVYRLAKRLANELRCVVVLITHPGHEHPDRPAGASSQEQDADFMIRVGANELYVKKVKESAAGTRRMFEVRSLGDSAHAALIGLPGQIEVTVQKQRDLDLRIACAVKRLQGTHGVSQTTLYNDVGGNRGEFRTAVTLLIASGRLRNAGTHASWQLHCDEDVDCTDV